MLELLIAAAATAATPTTMEVTPHRLKRDGVTATYTRSVTADGTIHLIGTYEDSSRSKFGRDRFHFKVRGNEVQGDVGGLAYVFSRPRAK
jgi:hypothetical protein